MSNLTRTLIVTSGLINVGITRISTTNLFFITRARCLAHVVVVIGGGQFSISTVAHVSFYQGKCFCFLLAIFDAQRWCVAFVLEISIENKVSKEHALPMESYVICDFTEHKGNANSKNDTLHVQDLKQCGQLPVATDSGVDYDKELIEVNLSQVETRTC